MITNIPSNLAMYIRTYVRTCVRTKIIIGAYHTYVFARCLIPLMLILATPCLAQAYNYVAATGRK